MIKPAIKQHMRLWAWILCLPIITVCVLGGYFIYTRPMPVQSADNLIIRVPVSTSASRLVHLLYAQHWIHYPQLWVMALRLTGQDSQLKAGIYQIKTTDSAWRFIQRVVTGDVLKEKFCIIEGTNQWQVKTNLMHAAYLQDPNTAWLAAQNNQHASIEGLLFADTYEYTAGSSASALVQRAQTKLTQNLSAIWTERDADLPYKNAYELLIAASILEKETMWPAERRVISGVIVNRLVAHMPLQMDPTVHYALGHEHFSTLKHADLSVNSKFNTYKNYGLPPTPIAMVSLDALVAAAHPARTKYLYFVAKGDGKHQFSNNYQQHLLAIKQLRQH